MRTEAIASPLTRVYNRNGAAGSIDVHLRTMRCPACGQQESHKPVVRQKHVEGMPWQEWHCSCNGEPFQPKYWQEPEPCHTQMNYNPNGVA